MITSITSGCTNVQADNCVNAVGFKPVKIQIEHVNHFDQRQSIYSGKFLLQENGKPVKNLHYRLNVEDGQIIHGVTGKDGETVTVYSKLKNARVDIYQTEMLRFIQSSSDYPVSYYKIQYRPGMFFTHGIMIIIFGILGWVLVCIQNRKNHHNPLVKRRGLYCLLYVITNAILWSFPWLLFSMFDDENFDIWAAVIFYVTCISGSLLSIAQNNNQHPNPKKTIIFLCMMGGIGISPILYNIVYPAVGWDGMGIAAITLLTSPIVFFVIFYMLSLTFIKYYNYVVSVKCTRNTLYISTIFLLLLTILQFSICFFVVYI